MGAVPYRDIVDINMPLTYDIHAAVVAIGGMSDLAWRIFDLTTAAVMSALILMLVGPAGRAAAVLAMLAVLVTHLLHSAYAAGQRDFLLSIPAVAVALVSARAAEDHEHRRLYLLLAGALAMTAASIKPSGILLLFLPALATKLRGREMILILLGAAGVGLRNVGGSGRIGRVHHDAIRTFAFVHFDCRRRAFSSCHSQSGRMDGTNRRTCGRCCTEYSRT